MDIWLLLADSSSKDYGCFDVVIWKDRTINTYFESCVA